MSSLPIVETVVNFVLAALRDGGLPALVGLMLIESFGIPPIPSEVILPFAGFLVSQGDYSFAAAVLAALAGSLVGSYLAYAVGRWGRHLLVSGPKFLRLEPRHLERMDDWFRRRGESTVLIARLLPVVRSYISYPAGTARMEPVRFGVFTLVGATPFVAAFVYAGVLLGPSWDRIVPFLQYADDAAIAAIVVGAVWLGWRWYAKRAASQAPAPPPAG